MTLTKKLFTTLLLALFVITINCHGDDDHNCEHDEIEQNPEFADIEEDTTAFEDGRILQSSSYPKIRIYTYFDFLKNTASSSYISYIQNDIVPPMMDYFEATLSIKAPVVGKLLLGSSVSKICEQSTPSILKSGGVTADFFLYFDSHAPSGTQIANSMYCYLASGTKRPIVGRIKMNRNMLKPTTNVLTHEKNMYTMMHEIMHLFGFGSSLFRYFIDSNGRTRTGHIKSVSIAGATRTVLDLPPLTQKLRDHFGCSSIPGAIMENGGGSSTASSHLERKYFLYEAMTSGSIAGRKISEISLALIEGTGWYVPDYSYAEPFFFGKGQGCGFINGKCSSSSASFEEYCVGSTRGCAPHGRGGGYCNSDSIMDGCKFNFPHQDYDCDNEDGADNSRLPDLQVYGRGAGSKCFTGTLNTRSSTSPTSFCFKYSCSGSGTSTRLTIQVGKTSVVCTKEGTQSVSGYYGVVNCPDPLSYCNTIGKKTCQLNCMGRGTCVNGTCQCRSGYKGIDCSMKA